MVGRSDFAMRPMVSAMNLITRLIIRSLAGSAMLAAASSEVNAAMFRVDGFNPAVYYTAPRPVETGDAESDLGIVAVHGWGGGAKDQTRLYNSLADNLSARGAKPVIVAPMFPVRNFIAKKKMPDDGSAVWGGYWEVGEKGAPANDWRGGGDAYGTRISSFDVIDRLLSILSDERLYPKIKRIVIVGFSAGGQVAGRYAAIGRCSVRKGVTVDFAVIAPGFEFMLEKDVPWHYGLKNMPRYGAKLDERQIYANLSSRRVWRSCGTEDNRPSTPKNKWALRQGPSRYDRHKRFEQYLKSHPEWNSKVSFSDIPGVAHTHDVWKDPKLLDFLARGDPLN
jgi:pimeloyl-ACP methyl ester carboxylesterase